MNFLISSKPLLSEFLEVLKENNKLKNDTKEKYIKNTLETIGLTVDDLSLFCTNKLNNSSPYLRYG